MKKIKKHMTEKLTIKATSLFKEELNGQKLYIQDREAIREFYAKAKDSDYKENDVLYITDENNRILIAVNKVLGGWGQFEIGVRILDSRADFNVYKLRDVLMKTFKGNYANVLVEAN